MEFRKIENYDGYKVYENGDVYCGDKKVEPGLHKTNNRWCVSIKNNKNRTTHNTVAKLVYELFNKKVRC